MKYILVSLLLFILSPSSSANAWGSKVHQKAASDAYHIMPKAFREYLGERVLPNKTVHRPALRLLMTASVEPDKVLRDFQNHIFHIQVSSMGKAPFHIENLINEITDDIKSARPRTEIIRKLGHVSHYISDLVQPLHTGTQFEGNIEEKSYHSATERDADKYVLTYGVKFDGCFVVKRISARMIYEALWANQFYDKLESAYTSGGRYKEVRPVISTCYSRAVNNIVDLWYTAWVNAGGKTLPSDEKSKYYPPIEKFRFAEN